MLAVLAVATVPGLDSKKKKGAGARGPPQGRQETRGCNRNLELELISQPLLVAADGISHYLW